MFQEEVLDPMLRDLKFEMLFLNLWEMDIKKRLRRNLRDDELGLGDGGKLEGRRTIRDLIGYTSSQENDFSSSL